MKWFFLSLGSFLVSQSVHAAGCTTEQANRLIMEKIVAAVTSEDMKGDLTQTRLDLLKSVAGTRPYLINSQFATFSFKSQHGSGPLVSGWFNVEVQNRNACFSSGSWGTEPMGNVKLNEYLQENNMGSLMRSQTVNATPAAPSTPAAPAATAAVAEGDGGD